MASARITDTVSLQGGRGDEPPHHSSANHFAARADRLKEVASSERIAIFPTEALVMSSRSRGPHAIMLAQALLRGSVIHNDNAAPFELRAV